MKNVHALRDGFAPISNTLLFDDQVNGARAFPRFQDEMLVEICRLGLGIRFKDGRPLIDEKEFLLEVKTEAAPVAGGSFKDNAAAGSDPWIEVLGGVCQGIKGGDARTRFG